MILKIFNEITGNWFYLDDVHSVDVNTDYCFHIPKDSPNSFYGVLKVYKPEKSRNVDVEHCDILKGRFIPVYDKDSVEIPENYGLGKNASSVCVTDYVLAKRDDRYREDFAYSAKCITAKSRSNGDATTFLLPDRADAFLLNSDGKTIDRL